MKSYTIPWRADGPTLELVDALTAAGLPPLGVALGDGTITATFDPDLTPAQVTEAQGIVDDILRAHRTRDLSLTFAEYQSIKADLAGLRQYLGVASPTAAQTAQATKAIIRVLRAMLSDS